MKGQRLVYMCQGLNSHYFHIMGDGHQPNSRGLYTHYKDSLLKVGGLPSPIQGVLTLAHMLIFRPVNLQREAFLQRRFGNLVGQKKVFKRWQLHDLIWDGFLFG